MAHIITNLNRLDAGIPDTVSHWLVFPAKLSHWLISRRHPRHGQSLAGFSRQAFSLADFRIDAGIPDTVSHWLFFPPSFLIG
jgi:hypothetical protein